MRLALHVALWVAFLGCASCAPEPKSAAAQDQVPASRRTRIVLAGDSLVSDDVGWGGAFAERMKPKADVVLAVAGGKGSATYFKTAQWRQALDSRADVMLLEVGTNDSPAFGARNPTTPEMFAKNLGLYLADARSKGIKLVLVTPTARRVFTGAADNRKIVSDVAPYAAAVIDVARRSDTPCIDLHSWSVDYFERRGERHVQAESLRTADGGIDTTHLAEPWRSPVADFIVEQLHLVIKE